MRWISDKTAVVVSQVEPLARVRVEIDESAATSEIVRVVEEPEPALRRLLMRLGRHYRRPVTTLRWDPGATMSRIGVRTEAWHAAQLPPPETPTRLVAQIARRVSPPLFVGGPVQIRLEHTGGVDARLGVPIVAGLDASAGARRSRNGEVSAIAYGAIDPLLSVRALTPTDDEFGEHYLRAIEETSARYQVASWVLHDAWRDALRGFDGPLDVQSESIEVHVEEGESRPLSVRLHNVPSHAFPMLLGAFGTDGRLVSTSELVVFAD